MRCSAQQREIVRPAKAELGHKRLARHLRRSAAIDESYVSRLALRRPFLDGAWWTFDPRNNVPRIGRIVVARGRDAADIPLIMSFGPHLLKSFRVWTYEVVDLPAAENANPEN